MERYFSLEAFERKGIVVEIGTDASPWGLGGWISVGGRIVEYFSCPITALDVARYGHAIGCNKGQQLWECLAILIAVRLWAHIWSRERIVLRICGDNVGALTLLVKLRPPTKNPAMGIIARELALDLAQLSFQPDATHTPGLSHVVADVLSRVHSPDGSGRVSSDLHPALAGAEGCDMPCRSEQWYQAYQARKASGMKWAGRRYHRY